MIHNNFVQCERKATNVDGLFPFPSYNKSSCRWTSERFLRKRIATPASFIYFRILFLYVDLDSAISHIEAHSLLLIWYRLSMYGAHIIPVGSFLLKL